MLQWTDSADCVSFCECVRATVEAHQNVPSDKLPPVTVTVASNDVDFIIRYFFVFLLPFCSHNNCIVYFTVLCWPTLWAARVHYLLRSVRPSMLMSRKLSKIVTVKHNKEVGTTDAVAAFRCSPDAPPPWGGVSAPFSVSMLDQSDHLRGINLPLTSPQQAIGLCWCGTRASFLL